MDDVSSLIYIANVKTAHGVLRAARYVNRPLELFIGNMIINSRLATLHKQRSKQINDVMCCVLISPAIFAGQTENASGKQALIPIT